MSNSPSAEALQAIHDLNEFFDGEIAEQQALQEEDNRLTDGIGLTGIGIIAMTCVDKAPEHLQVLSFGGSAALAFGGCYLIASGAQDYFAQRRTYAPDHHENQSNTAERARRDQADAMLLNDCVKLERKI